MIDAIVPLPPALARFGEATRATLVGAEGAPVVAMIGGISGNRFPCRAADGGPGWWAGLACAGGGIDPARYRILGFDFAADESGAVAPAPADQAAVLAAVLDALGIAAVRAIVGASYGGMVALAFAEQFAARIEQLAIISADAGPHPYSTAQRELQRRVVRMGLDQGRGDEALGIARGMAMLTYRSAEEFDDRFAGGIDGADPLAVSAPGEYLRARGSSYPAVMSPGRFLSLSASIDRHRCRPERIAAPAVLIGADSDLLVPPVQMRRLAAALAGPATLHLLPSRFGHDMFLKEVDEVGALLRVHFPDPI